MKKLLKYGVFPVVTFVFLMVVTVMLLPVLINVQKYVPELEKSISKAAGRPFSIGPDVALSFFPALSLSFSDLKLGNPTGFVSDHIVRIDSFEARVKLLPLLKKEIRITRFVVGGLEINLEKNSEGRVNWDFLRSVGMPRLEHVQDHVSCTLLAVTDGRLNWIDRTNYLRHSVEDFMLLLNNVQANHPVTLDFRASYDGKPLSLEGQVGPLTQQQRLESLPVDLAFRLADILQGKVRGKVENWRSAPVYDLAFEVPSFSPRELFVAMKRDFPFPSADPTAFQTVDVSLAVKGDPRGFAIGPGAVRLDDTQAAFSGEVTNLMEKPDVRLDLDVDRLDLDRYVPPAGPEAGDMDAEGRNPLWAVRAHQANTAALAGSVKVGVLRARGLNIEGFAANFDAKDGNIRLDQVLMKLHGGQLQGDFAAEFSGISGEAPKMQVTAETQGVDAAAVLRGVFGREVFTGALSGELKLEFSGDSADGMLKSLRGEGHFTCIDGTLPGVDLQRSLERRELVLAHAAGGPDQVQTDFAELKGAVTLDQGVLNLHDGILASPAMTLDVAGGADFPAGEWQLQLGRQGMEPQSSKGKGNGPLALAGKFEGNLPRQPVNVPADGKKVNVAILVDAKIPRPADEDVKDLEGKPLIDPAIVAQRFHLQRETIRRSEAKKQLQLGSGKIRIGPLQEETSL